MTAKSVVFLDANVIIYALDKTSELHSQTVAVIQELQRAATYLCTSHHVIEEVLHVVQKIATNGVTPSQVVAEISKIPRLTLIEPAADIDFARRYAMLSAKLQLGINDALIVQLILDAGIDQLFSYDLQLVQRAHRVGIQTVATN